MENEDANPPLESRIPTLEDLLFLCRWLNEVGAKYVVIGGWAVIQHGFDRTTSEQICWWIHPLRISRKSELRC